MQFMNEQDAPIQKLGEVFVTIEGRRYSMLMAKSVKAKATITTTEIPVLGKLITGRKATSMAVQLTMTIYKCTEIFDDVVEKFKKTGVLPTFEVQVTNEDGATSIGRSTKIYRDCIIDGDVLLNLVATEESAVEQEITMYAADYDSAEKYSNPSYM